MLDHKFPSAGLETTLKPEEAISPPSPDLQLIERARTRDMNAWRALMQRHNQRLFRIARSMVTSAEAAAERVQDAYLHASASLAHYDPAEKPANWLSRIVHGRTVSARRAPLTESEAADSATPGVMASQGGDARTLEQAIDALPEVFRPVLVLRVLEGLSGPDTAASLLIKEVTVRTRLHRALRRLPAGMAERMSSERSAIYELEETLGERIIQSVLTRLKR
jgi:RNA polymerase sigma-70 factor (ECF subfamily)